MTIETDQDRAGFFQAGDFATAAVIGNVTVLGLFDSAYLSVHDIDTEHPAFTAPSVDLADVDYGDSVTINEQAYTIRSIQPDYFGVTTLILSAQ